MIYTKLSYPEYYFSIQIYSILNRLPELPQEPPEPKKPLEPKNPGEYKRDVINSGCEVIFFLIVTVLVVWMAFIYEKTSVWIIILCVYLSINCLGVAYYAIIGNKRHHKKEVKKYNDEMKKYFEEKEKFDEDLIVYKQEKQYYDIKVKDILSKSNVDNFRANLIKETYKSPFYKSCDDYDYVKKGASEMYFFEYLKEKTDWNIIIDQKVPVDEKYYYPDFIIEINGIYFDIEIDEPYSGNDGTPIHYIDGIFPKSIDDYRNSYMSNRGWNVIRFSEEQIFMQTNECVQFIGNVYKAIDNGNLDIIVPEHFIKDKWTKDQSYKMSYKRFRRTYVPEEYQLYIDKEDNRSYSEIRSDIYK